MASEALEDLLRLEARHPDLADVHYALAFFARTLERPELEREQLERYLEMAPAGPTVAQAKARLAEIRRQ
jgi:hypothetical protein